MERATQTTEIKSRPGWFDIDIKGIRQYKDLIKLLVKRDLALVYKQTALGPLWLFINPLISSIVYTIIFGRLAELSSDGAPQLLFYLSGTSLWSLFSRTLTDNANTFITNKAVFGKVYFPRLVAPISQTITSAITFIIQLLLLAVFFVIYSIKGAVALSPWVLLLPVLTVQCALLGMGMGMIISALTTKYRDLAIAIGFGLQLWMYASPVVYPLSSTLVTPRVNFVLRLNPMTAILENFRFALLGSGKLMIGSWIVSWCTTLVVVFIGVLLFCRTEKTFTDTI